MATDYKLINLRIPVDWYEQILAVCDANGITLSEFVRGVIKPALDGLPPGSFHLGGLDEGYRQGRALASKIAHGLLENALASLPDTYEEAVARYDINNPHRTRG